MRRLILLVGLVVLGCESTQAEVRRDAAAGSSGAAGAAGQGATAGAAGEAGASAACPVGTEGCPCYGNDTCNAGLVCDSDLCSSAGAGGSAGAAPGTCDPSLVQGMYLYEWTRIAGQRRY